MKYSKQMLNECSISSLNSFCELKKIKPITNLKYGMDFRKPEYRREVFLRFYEFHLKYKSHAGAVYFMFPFLQKKFNLTMEEMLWLTFINGLSQNIISTWLIFKKFPSCKTNPENIQLFINNNWKGIGWDMDRRYVKIKFKEALSCYQKLLGKKTQVEFWNQICNSSDKYKNFRNSWELVMKKFKHFGRLSTFSYLEYQKIIGLNLDCDSLFLDDIAGSKSHRNGIVKVIGRDDLDCHDKLNPNFKGYSKDELVWLENEGESLLKESKQRFKNKKFKNDISYFTLETTLCCYKSWHRLNRRYPNVYMDMFYERIINAQSYWKEKENFEIFWEARREFLPKELRLEDNKNDVGLKPLKQNHYLKTGQVIIMDLDWDCFKNDYKKICSNLKKQKKIIIIGGLPVSGKTTLMRKIRKELGPYKENKLNTLRYEEYENHIVFGIYKNEMFDGTDKLSMSVINDTISFLKTNTKIILLEGDRLFNNKFINSAKNLNYDVKIIICELTDETKLLERYKKRGRIQTQAFLKGRHTKIKNIMQNHPHKIINTNKTIPLSFLHSLNI